MEAIVAGGFGGGHSSGGFSGGGRSSSGGFSSRGFGSSGPSGFHHDSPRPRPFFVGGPHYYYGGGPRYGYGSGWTFIIVFIVLILLMTYSINSLNTQNSTKVSKNTTQRTALSGVVSKTDWYEDNIGWVVSKSTLISGLEKFYKETGIQPYILFVPYSTTYWSGTTLQTSKADQYLEEVYSEKFTDEGHFIFAYFQCANDSKSEMDGEFRYLSGYSADTIMDSEAISILWGYFEKNYYNTSLSLEKMISNTFEETAESIMSKPTNAWDVAKVVIIIVAIIIVILIIYKIIKNNNSRAKEKEEYTKEILDKPLETFGTDTSELEKKYENNN